MITVILHRIVAAFTTPLTRSDWRYTLALLGILSVVLLPLGLGTGFLHWETADLSWDQAVSLVMVVFVTPALVEEFFFRALLLPHPQEPAGSGTRWVVGTLGLAAYVASHPLNAMLFPVNHSTFTDPRFLLLATELGVACTLAYYKSGSLWPPVFLHGLIVNTWLLLFDGHARLT